MLSERQKSCIIGMLLGDACIPTSNTNLLKVWHSIKQEDYVKHKHRLLMEWFGKHNKIQYQSQPHYSGKVYSTCGFGVSNQEIASLHRLLYKNNRKTFTDEALRMLTPEGIAYWYMDDGSCSMRSNCNGFMASCTTDISTYTTEGEANTIVEYFNESLGIVCKKRPSKRTQNGFLYNINMNTKQSIKFCEMIQPFVIESMGYKLRHVAGVLSKAKIPPNGLCSQCGNEKQTSGKHCRRCQVAASNAQQRI